MQGRDELFSRIFLHNSQSWAIVGEKKKEDYVTTRKNRKENLSMERKAHNYGKVVILLIRCQKFSAAILALL